MAYRPISINPDQAVAQIQQAKQLGVQDAARGIQNIGSTISSLENAYDADKYKQAQRAFIEQLGAPVQQEQPQGEQPVIQPLTGQEITTEQQEASLQQGGLIDDQTRTEFMEDTQELVNADPTQMVAKLSERNQKLQSQGRDSSDTQQLIQLAATNPQQAQAAIGNINQMIRNKNFREMLKYNPQAALGLAQGLAPQAGKPQEMSFEEKERLKTEIGESKDRRKEMRGRINARYKDIDKQISGIEDTQKTVANLAKAVYSGNRNAVSNLMVKLVKSGDPNSAVLAGEMMAAMNIEGFKEVLAGGNFNPIEMADAMRKEIAALSPESVNLEDIMEVADINKRSMMGSIQDSYNMALEERALLPSEGQKDTFSKIRDDKVKGFTSESDIPVWFFVAGLDDKSIKTYMDGVPGASREDAIEALAVESKIRGGRAKRGGE